MDGLASLESVVTILSSVWEAVEGTAGADRVKLKADIIRAINVLKSRVENRLAKRTRAPSKEQFLFSETEEESRAVGKNALEAPQNPRFPEPSLRIYKNDLTEHSLQHIPRATRFATAHEFRKYLAGSIRFNSLASRRRAANYLINRFFPGKS